MLLKKTVFKDGRFENYPDIPLKNMATVDLCDGVSVAREGECCRIYSGSVIRINNQEHVGEKILSNLMVIEAGGAIFVFEDEAAEKAFLDMPTRTEEKVERISDVESRYSPASIQALKQRHYKLFCGNGKMLKTKHGIAERIVRYATIKLNWERACVMEIIEKSGKSIAASGRFKLDIPKALVFPVWREKKAQKYVRNDAEEKGKHATMSIVENDVGCAMISPFMYGLNNRIVAILYADTPAEAIEDAAYFLLDHVCREITPKFVDLLDFPVLKEIDV